MQEFNWIVAVLFVMLFIYKIVVSVYKTLNPHSLPATGIYISIK